MPRNHWNYTSDQLNIKVIRQLAEQMSQYELDLVDVICQRRFGRVIIEGEGALVSLACAIVYKSEWPLLIVTPNCLVHSWREFFI